MSSKNVAAQLYAGTYTGQTKAYPMTGHAPFGGHGSYAPVAPSYYNSGPVSFGQGGFPALAGPTAAATVASSPNTNALSAPSDALRGGSRWNPNTFTNTPAAPLSYATLAQPRVTQSAAGLYQPTQFAMQQPADQFYPYHTPSNVTYSGKFSEGAWTATGKGNTNFPTFGPSHYGQAPYHPEHSWYTRYPKGDVKKHAVKFY